MLKQFKLWKIFEKSNEKKKIEFYNILLEQVKKVIDFKSIFDLFPLDNIDYNFINLINRKIAKQELLYSCLNEKEENLEILFKIFKNLIVINHSFEDFNLEFPITIVQISYDFTSKYYFYLLKREEINDIVMEVKDYIISFFIKQTYNNCQNAESLISLLLLSKDKDFSINLLNLMNHLIINENDFYQKEENENFKFFKVFFEKCKDLQKNEYISNGNYIVKSIEIKNKILNDLKISQIPFKTFSYL